MSRGKHTEAQMIGALKQVEAGRKVEDVAREVGVSKHTVYAWKAKYGGMDASQAQEAKQLRDENTRKGNPGSLVRNWLPRPARFSDLDVPRPVPETHLAQGTFHREGS